MLDRNLSLIPSLTLILLLALIRPYIPLRYVNYEHINYAIVRDF